ncbi:MAG: hypothetical protein IJO00_03605 [Clostridia bacterium]|nr:hypothetical protein [Clostridia bacterium]
MKLLKAKFEELKSALSGIKELQVSLKGNAEISLHKRSEANSPKMRAEIIEDGTTVNVTDILLIGAAVCAFVGICSAISDFID